MGSQSGEKVDMSKVQQGESPVSDLTIQIYIRTLTQDTQTHTLRIDRSVPVPALRQQVAAVTGVQPEHQRLVYLRRELRDDRLLSHYHVEEGHTLHLVFRDTSSSPSHTTDNQTGPNNLPRAAGTAAFQGHQPPPVFPDSLTTLSLYLNRVAHDFRNPSIIPPGPGILPPYFVSVPSFRNGIPTAEFLAQVLQSTRQLLTVDVATTIRDFEEELQNQQYLTDVPTRGHVQLCARISGITFQNLGALFLELGRTIALLEMGVTPANAVVPAGPALYINESEPNLMMFVQGQPSTMGNEPTGARLDDRPRLVPISQFIRPTGVLRPVPIVTHQHRGQVNTQSRPGTGRPAPAAQHPTDTDFSQILRDFTQQLELLTATRDRLVNAVNASVRARQTAPAPSDDRIFLSDSLQPPTSGSAGPSSTRVETENQQGSSARGTLPPSASSGSRRQPDPGLPPESKRQTRE